MTRLLWLPLLALLLTLSACGGGGDESSSTPDGATDGATEAVDETAVDETDSTVDETDDPADGTEVSTEGDAATGTEAADAAAEAPTANPTVLALAQSFEPPTKGDPDAPLTLYDFSDYACPYCRSFAMDTLPEVDENYIQTGKLKMIFIDFPLPSHGFPGLIGSEAAHCAGEQDRYWEMHDAIYGAFRDLADIDPEDEEATTAKLIEIGSPVVDDSAAFAECVKSHDYRAIVASLQQQARESGVEVTPTLYLISDNHQETIPGFLDYVDFEPILEREYLRALGTVIPDPTPEPTVPPEDGGEGEDEGGDG